MPAAVAAVALSYVASWLAYVPALITAYCLDLLTGTVRLVGHFRLSDVRVPTPTLAMSLAAAAAFGITCCWRAGEPLTGVARHGRAAGCGAVDCRLPARPQLQRGVLEVTAIDVGQGDSLLIVTPQGRTVLMDSGGLGATSRSDFDVGEEVVSPYLWSRGFRRLDAVAISHAHSDHIGGMRSYHRQLPSRELWYGVDSPTHDFAGAEEDCRRLWRRAEELSCRGRVRLSAARMIRVLNPQVGWEPRPKAEDDESMVLRLQYGDTSALLVGDSHCRIEKFLMEENPRADLLKVGAPRKPDIQLAGVSGQRCIRSSRWFRRGSTIPSAIPGRR